jgi:hypothetical protein
MKKLPRTLGLAITALIACTLGGCSSYGSLCAARMDCEGGNEADYDACMLGYETTEELSNLHGCGDFLDRYLVCFEAQSHCDGSADRWTDDNDCDDERRDLNDCID